MKNKGREEFYSTYKMLKITLKDGTVIEISGEIGLAEASKRLLARKQELEVKKIRRRLKARRCVIDGKPLPLRKKKYCSPECQKEGMRRRAREFYAKKKSIAIS